MMDGSDRKRNPRAPRRIGAAVAAVVLTLIATSCAAGPTGVPTSSGTSTPAVFPRLPTADLDASTAGALDSTLASFVDAGMPAVIAAVVTADGQWTGAAGVDGADGRSADDGDEFAIASITKVFTAALVMRLVEDGELKLDEPLSTYLDDGIDSNGATVLQALQMRSGVPDTSDGSIAKIAADRTHVWTESELTAEFPEPTADPGTEYQYSNPTYKMLGLAAEHVTGLALADAVRTLLLDPAGSAGTLLVQGGDAPTPQPWALPVSGTEAPIDSFGLGSSLPNVADASFSAAGSGMAGTAVDVARWSWQLFAGEVIDPSSLAQLTTTTDDDGSGTGLDELTGQGLPGAFGHTGSKDGYQSLLAVYPDDQTVIVVLVTERDADVGSVVSALKDALAG